jgi:hypothetical protein
MSTFTVYREIIMARITPYSSMNLVEEAGVDTAVWNKIPSPTVLGNTITEIENNKLPNTKSSINEYFEKFQLI